MCNFEPFKFKALVAFIRIFFSHPLMGTKFQTLPYFSAIFVYYVFEGYQFSKLHFLGNFNFKFLSSSII